MDDAPERSLYPAPAVVACLMRAKRVATDVNGNDDDNDDVTQAVARGAPVDRAVVPGGQLARLHGGDDGPHRPQLYVDPIRAELGWPWRHTRHRGSAGGGGVGVSAGASASDWTVVGSGASRRGRMVRGVSASKGRSRGPDGRQDGGVNEITSRSCRRRRR